MEKCKGVLGESMRLVLNLFRALLRFWDSQIVENGIFVVYEWYIFLRPKGTFEKFSFYISRSGTDWHPEIV